MTTAIRRRADLVRNFVNPFRCVRNRYFNFIQALLPSPKAQMYSSLGKLCAIHTRATIIPGSQARRDLGAAPSECIYCTVP
jgi:hypothetical protein